MITISPGCGTTPRSMVGILPVAAGVADPFAVIAGRLHHIRELGRVVGGVAGRRRGHEQRAAGRLERQVALPLASVTTSTVAGEELASPLPAGSQDVLPKYIDR
jgi:hypothetical protein